MPKRESVKHTQATSKKRPVEKFADLIISTVQSLRDTKGSNEGRILDHISVSSNSPRKRIAREVKAALKQGIGCGIPKRYQGRYYVPPGDDLERANQIATRFANLRARNASSGSRHPGSRNNPATRKASENHPTLDSAKRSNSNHRYSTKKARSIPLSLAFTTTEQVSCPSQELQ